MATPYTSTSTPKKSYETITDRIIEQPERGVAPPHHRRRLEVGLCSKFRPFHRS